ncbi:MAG TPA: carboxypeptidase-like regulatory domain-containing protein [Blastocatellia bacterium]|nr:carboxypeptidase-like regulatory domain-containing protein [Blastocatellia bacterium]
MKRLVIVFTFLAIVARGQEHSLPPQRVVPQSAPGTVTLTLVEYNRLLDLATHKPKPTEAAPLPYVLSRAAFKLRLDNDSVVGALEIDGDVLQKGMTMVPLAAGLTITEALPTPKPLPLLQDGAATATVIDGPGAFAVTLNVASPVTVDAGRASFTLPVPRAASSIFSLDIPGNHADVHVEPGLVTNRSTVNGHTIIEATLEPGKPAKVWWTTREISAPVMQREVRFLADMKTLISVGDSELRMAVLCDVNVVQGEPAEFRLPLPPGFEVTEVSGSTLDSSETQGGELVLKVREPARRAHQFLIAVERASRDNKLDAPFFGFSGVQGETGEVLIEGVGTMELTATEGGGLRRVDVREVGPITRSLARFPVQAAFRYHRRQGDAPSLKLEWNRFPDGAVLSAIVERATITTLLNVEGKSLTEVTLKVRNHAQPFVKVELPQGASLLSAEVEGEKVKPVQGSDGSRVPLLRAGFRPAGAYTVSFVYLSAGTPFAKSGAYDLTLPKMDVPINLVTWEVFLPERLEVKQFGGTALAASLFPARAQDVLVGAADDFNEIDQNAWMQNDLDLASMQAGQIGGIVVDPQGAVIPGAKVTVTNPQTRATQTTTTDGEGHWVISGMQPGPVSVRVDSQGFRSSQQDLNVDSSRPARLGITLNAGATSETVTVTSDAVSLERESRRLEDQASKTRAAQVNAPSQNVFSLQRKVAGILPVRVDVPRAGRSYRFVRPLVVEEETKITFQYRAR